MIPLKQNPATQTTQTGVGGGGVGIGMGAVGGGGVVVSKNINNFFKSAKDSMGPQFRISVISTAVMDSTRIVSNSELAKKGRFRIIAVSKRTVITRK